MPGEPATDRYQPFYCEENVFYLAGQDGLASRRREVVFITNATRSCAVFHQRARFHEPAGSRGRRPMVWDYHVVLLCADPWEVFDLDTTLACPCPAKEYFEKSFDESLPVAYHPRFRVIDADVYRATLVSDRSHMRDGAGRFLKPPPPWPPIGGGSEASQSGSNLDRFIDLERPFVGEVMSLRELGARVGE